MIATPRPLGIVAGGGPLLALAFAILASAAPALADANIPIIDTHSHLVRNIVVKRKGGSPQEIDAVASAALVAMAQHGVIFEILTPPPFPPMRSATYGLTQLEPLARAHPDRFGFTAGGDTLNQMIQEVAPERVTPDIIRRFEREAETIAQSSAAGFGELAAEHFAVRSFSPDHPYESVQPDHPLLLALTDIAAKYGMPIELHMEAVPRDMPFPNAALAGPPNPPKLKENIAAFERLLDHNRDARIVWIHAGWDLTGGRTVPLMTRLLQKHPNLYMSVTHGKYGTPLTSPFMPGGGLKPGWVAMMRAYPDRFMVGSDQFYELGSGFLNVVRAFVDALPPDLAQPIASENAKHVYRLARAPQ